MLEILTASVIVAPAGLIDLIELSFEMRRLIYDQKSLACFDLVMLFSREARSWSNNLCKMSFALSYMIKFWRDWLVDKFRKQRRLWRKATTLIEELEMKLRTETCLRGATVSRAEMTKLKKSFQTTSTSLVSRASYQAWDGDNSLRQCNNEWIVNGNVM